MSTAPSVFVFHDTRALFPYRVPFVFLFLVLSFSQALTLSFSREGEEERCAAAEEREAGRALRGKACGQGTGSSSRNVPGSIR